MKNYQKLHYEEYRIMLSDGSSIQTTRRECFAPAEPVTVDNPYPQRWFYSPDGQLAIRLPRNELGEQYGKDNAAELKSEERSTERKNLCIGQTSHASCCVTCDGCPFSTCCDSKYRAGNGVGCKRILLQECYSVQAAAKVIAVKSQPPARCGFVPHSTPMEKAPVHPNRYRKKPF
ncbi:hypothetical protein [Pygmaiobacter massiliensis]|uniref:hypothetical protein n=1 Tax=Pygmaiobacter massiliensis TaxID=1917873 RepID=UPI002A8289F4|nr:hypothetical protein [Pygmaiobacter massiliensis]MDY4784093.1 hypothetical protein [Pygmaiobacter massiliensis]